MTENQIKANEHQKFELVNIREISSLGIDKRERKAGLLKPASSDLVKEREKSPDGRSKPATVPRVGKAKAAVYRCPASATIGRCGGKASTLRVHQSFFLPNTNIEVLGLAIYS
jgi:hypothetical protein